MIDVGTKNGARAVNVDFFGGRVKLSTSRICSTWPRGPTGFRGANARKTYKMSEGYDGGLPALATMPKPWAQLISCTATRPGALSLLTS